MSRLIFTSSRDVENAFYEALQRADIEALMAVWSEDEEIICVLPGGPRLKGYAAIREAWQQVFSSGKQLRIRITEPAVIQTPFTAVHSLVMEISLVGSDTPRAPIAATNIYLRGPLGWRMLVHHASPVPPTTPETPKVLH